MANEITLNISMAYLNAGTSDSLAAATNLSVDVAAKGLLHTTQAVGAVEEALILGDISTPGYFEAVNLGSVDTISIRSGTGLADLVALKPGDACCFRFDADASAPFLISSGSEGPELEFILLEA